MVYYIHDMIEDYDDQYDEDIQWKTSRRKEFFSSAELLIIILF